MKNPVIPVKDFIVFLEETHTKVVDKLKELPDTEELQKKAAKALSSRKKEEGALLFQNILGILKDKAYCEGQLDVLKFFIDDAKNKIKQYEHSEENK